MAAKHIEMTREQKFFWQQYYGRIKAIDLPDDYKLSDTRIYCVNKDCREKDSCLFYQRFIDACKTFCRGHFKLMNNAVKRDQKGWNRPKWHEHYPMPDYRNSSFGFLPEQKNTWPCKHFINADNKD